MSFLGRRAPRLSLVFLGGTTDRNWLTKNNRYLAAANRYHLTCGVIQRPGREKSALLAKRGAQSAPEQEFSAYHLFFFAPLAGYYRTLLYRDTRPLLASPPPPYAAAAARRRRTPPSSHHPPPPLPQHATAVTPESFADVPVCPYPRSYSSTIEQRIAWLASCKSCCCRRFSRLVPHSNDQHRRLAIVVRRRRLCHRGGSRRSSKGRRRGFRVGEDGHREDDPALLLPR